MEKTTSFVCKTCSAFKQNLVFLDAPFNEHFIKEHNCVFTRDCWRHIVDFASPFGVKELNKALIDAKLRQMEKW